MEQGNEMKKLALAGIVLGALVASVATPAANAADDPQGGKCAFNSATDLTGEPGHQTAIVRGGPLVTFGPGTLVCTIQTNASTHDAGGVAVPAGHSTAIAAGVNVSVLPPTSTSYPATALDKVFLCTSFVGDDGVTLYYTAGTPTGTWSTSASSDCGTAAITIDPNPEACPFLLAVDARAHTELAKTWQDCEPYSPII